MKPRLLILTLLILLALRPAPPARAEAGGDVHVTKGVQAYKSGEYQQAALELEAALTKELDRYDPETVYAVLGNAYLELGDLEKAEAAQKKALEIKPDFHVAWTNLGVIHRRSGDLNQAEQCYLKALEIKPDYAEAHSSLGVIHILRQEPLQAVEALEKAVRLDPQLATAQANLALAYAMTGRYDEADRALKQAVVLGYKNAEVIKARIEELKTLHP
ncbi:MAG: tetratricopeptide repeat protein [Thermodesulfobacteriota bacterium]